MEFTVTYGPGDKPGSQKSYSGDDTSFEVLPSAVLRIVEGGKYTHVAPHAWRFVEQPAPASTRLRRPAVKRA